MPINLSIQITSPLTSEDNDLLSGIAVMTLAIANHEMAKTKFPEAFGDDEDNEGETPVSEIPEEPTAPPVPCGLVDNETGKVCVAKSGHRGRHAMREVELTALPN